MGVALKKTKAKKENMVDELKIEIIDELSCRICAETYNDNTRRPIPCSFSHIVCSSCLLTNNEVIENTPGMDINQINKCPICRQKIIDETLKFGVRELPNLVKLFRDYEKSINRRSERLTKIIKR